MGSINHSDKRTVITMTVQELLDEYASFRRPDGLCGKWSIGSAIISAIWRKIALQRPKIMEQIKDYKGSSIRVTGSIEVEFFEGLSDNSETI